MIEDESKEPLYEQNHEEEIDDSESKIAAKIDLERLFDLMSNKRYVMVIRELVLKEVEPEFLALSMGITVANLYNIKKRALAALAHLAMNDKKKYENKDKNMITEELLAAFEEGKTNAEETALVLEYLATDESLQEEFILSQQLDAMMGADDEETDFLPMAQMAAKSEGNLCDFQCEQFILKRRKIEYNSDELSEEARNNSWLRERGTPLHSVGRLLEQRGIDCDAQLWFQY